MPLVDPMFLVDYAVSINVSEGGLGEVGSAQMKAVIIGTTTAV